MKTVSQLTVPQLETLIEKVIERKLLELFGDPDTGLELKPNVKAKLRRSMAAVKHGERGILTEEVEARFRAVKPTPEELGWPSSFFGETAGCFRDEPLVREPQGEYEIREELS